MNKTKKNPHRIRSFVMPDKDYAKLQKLAEEKGCSAAAYLRSMIRGVA